MASQNLVNTGSGNGLLLDDIKPITQTNVDFSFASLCGIQLLATWLWVPKPLPSSL